MNNSQRYDKLRGRATEEKPIDTSMMYGTGQHFSANATSRDLARMFRLYLPTLRIPGHQTSSQSPAKVIGSIIAEPCRPP